MTFILKSVLIVFYLSLNLAMGEVVQSEVLVWKSWQKLNTDLSLIPLSFDYSAQVGAISVNSWNLHIPSVTVHAETPGGTYQIDSRKVSLQFDNLKLTVQIPSLTLDQTIERVVNGTTLRVRVQSTCTPILVTNERIMSTAVLNWQWLDNVPVPFMDTMTLDWPDDSWAISELKCSGPAGIDTIFLGQLTSNLKDRNFIRSLVFEKIKDEIQNQWSGFHQGLISGNSPLLPVSSQGQLRLDRVALWTETGLGVLGRIQLDIDLPSESLPSTLIKFGEFDASTLKEQKILIPKKFVLLNAQQRIQKTQIEAMNLRHNSSFMSLLRSRFLQFFLWPDLMNFRKDALFEIGFQNFYNLVLDWKNQNLIQVSGNLNANLMGERDSAMSPYLDLAFGFSVNGNIQKVGTKLEITAEYPQINYSYRFNSDYTKKYSGSNHISSTIIKKAKSAIVDSLKIKTEFDLEGILGSSFRIKNFRLIDDTVLLDF